VFELDGDHDVSMVQGPLFARVTLDAVMAVTPRGMERPAAAAG
jgi:hypothetical protein